jgi:hypothetical protein
VEVFVFGKFVEINMLKRNGRLGSRRNKSTRTGENAADPIRRAAASMVETL